MKTFIEAAFPAIRAMHRRTHITSLPGWQMATRRRGGLEDCSLIVATCRRQAELQRLLDSLLEIPAPPGEVVIVDGAATPEGSGRPRQWAEAHDLPFDFRYVESPAGLTRQRNVGVDISTREYL